MTKEQIFHYLFILLIILATYQIFHWLFFYLRILIYKPKQTENTNEPVSIIIAARNEADNLQKNIPHFCKQKYPDYQVIVVNDASSDDSEMVLAQLKQQYSNLYYTSIPQDQTFFHSKKTALMVGIKAAKTELLVFSDADCCPASENWLSSIVKNFESNIDIIIGYGPYKQQKGLLDKIIRSETVLIAMQYLSFALAKIPYMAVGRNMAYRKSFFEKNKGFSQHINLLSGSDDLFVNQNANSKNIKVEISPESFTYSNQSKTFSEFFKQKIRHLTTSKYYKFKHKFLLAFEAFTRVFFFAMAIFFTLIPDYIHFSIAFLLTRMILSTTIMYLINKKLNEKNLIHIQIIYEIFQPIFNFILLIFARRKKEFLWK